MANEYSPVERPKRRWSLPLVSVAALLIATIGASGAFAQEMVTVEIRFWAFSANPQFFAYQTTNQLDEEMLVVGQVGSPEPVFVQAATEDMSVRDILISRELRDMYGWAADGTPGNPSPSGYTQITLADAGPSVAISARQGHYVNPLGQVNKLGDGGGRNFADVEIKEVYWSPDETVAVVVLEQTMGGEWPMDVQTAHGFAVPPRPEPQEAPPAEGGGGGE